MLYDRIRKPRACPADATHGIKALPTLFVCFVNLNRDGLGFREEWFKIECSVRLREGVDQYIPSLPHMNIISDEYVPSLPHMNIISAISRNSDMLFEIWSFIWIRYKNS